MIRQIKLVIVLVIISVTHVRGQDGDWTLPTPNAELLATSLIPYPTSVERLEGEFEFSYFAPSSSDADSVKLLELELEEVSAFWGMTKSRKGRKCKVEFLECENGDCNVLGMYKLECSGKG